MPLMPWDLRVRVLQDRLPVPGIYLPVGEDGPGGVRIPEAPPKESKKLALKGPN